MKCPLCGKDNNCYIDLGKDVSKCWCHSTKFPENLPVTDKCICIDCIKKLKTEELSDEIRTIEGNFRDDARSLGAIGWSKYFSKHGRMITSGDMMDIVGREAILKYMDPFFKDKRNSLDWEPTLIEFSTDYSLCYSSGSYKRMMDDKVTTGKYLTVWRKTKDSWEIELDIGN